MEIVDDNINPQINLDSNTVIVLISTHGSIYLTHDTNQQGMFDLDKKKLPDDMTLSILSLSAPGVCTYVSSDQIIPMQRNIKNILTSMKIDYNQQATPMNQFIGMIGSIPYFTKYFLTTVKRDFLQYLHKATYQINKKIENSKILRSSIDPDSVDFVRHEDLSLGIKLYEKGSLYPNKIYSRTLENRDESFKTKDYSMRLINVNGEPDYMNAYVHETGDVIVPLSNLVDDMYARGAKNIIVIDLSCSPMLTRPGTRASARTVRSIRRQSFRGGKRKHHGNKGKTTRPGIKRTSKNKRNNKHNKTIRKKYA